MLKRAALLVALCLYCGARTGSGNSVSLLRATLTDYGIDLTLKATCREDMTLRVKSDIITVEYGCPPGESLIAIPVNREMFQGTENLEVTADLGDFRTSFQVVNPDRIDFKPVDGGYEFFLAFGPSGERSGHRLELETLEFPIRRDLSECGLKVARVRTDLSFAESLFLRFTLRIAGREIALESVTAPGGFYLAASPFRITEAGPLVRYEICAGATVLTVGEALTETVLDSAFTGAYGIYSL